MVDWFWWVLDGLLLLSGVGIAIFWTRSIRSLDHAPRLQPAEFSAIPPCSIAVVIPAYNEAVNIEPCIRSVLASKLPESVDLQVWVADDESSDRTFALAAALVPTDHRLRVFRVAPRPTDRVWRGKNWACAQAAEAIGDRVDYLLFIDADVRLAPEAIGAALAEADRLQTDLFSCAPEIVCGCLSEWLVQPIVASAISVGFDFRSLNDRDNPIAFAAGPFMLFRRSSYLAIGGHAAVADDPVEDMALGMRIKEQGLHLYFLLGLGLVRVRMYQNFAALWEGWTKNWHIANERNLYSTLYGAFGIFAVFSMPWLGLMASAIGLGVFGPSLIGGLSLAGAIGATVALSWMRRVLAERTAQPLRYWWLGWVGGLLIAAIALVSIVKIETGWGWTWRGRSLATPSQQPLG